MKPPGVLGTTNDLYFFGRDSEGDEYSMNYWMKYGSEDIHNEREGAEFNLKF
jgi:hypothetical protein